MVNVNVNFKVKSSESQSQTTSLIFHDDYPLLGHDPLKEVLAGEGHSTISVKSVEHESALMTPTYRVSVAKRFIQQA